MRFFSNHHRLLPWVLLPWALFAALYLCLLLLDGGRREPAVAKTGSSRHVLVLSDTHIAGPELELDAESNQMDNLSVLRAMQRLYRVLNDVEDIEDVEDGHQPSSARPLVVVLGDVVHDGLRVLKDPNARESFASDLFEREVNGYTIARDLFRQFNYSQIIFTFGNHDALTTCGDASRSIMNKTLLAEVYERYFGSTPYGVTDDADSNWSFVRLNGMWGETWRAEGEFCNTELASFGVEQLQWLDATLRERGALGRFVMLLTHFPLTATVEQEHEADGAVNGTMEGLAAVLRRHEGVVKGVLTGHFHKGIEWGGSASGGIPVMTMPAVRYSDQNFFHLDLGADGGWRLVDFERVNKGGARCSDRHSSNRPVLHRHFRDAGDCGVPLVGHESDVRMDPISSMDVYPSEMEFNPEGSCLSELAPPFFAACTSDAIGTDKDAEKTCCAVLREAFWPGSSHPFSTCLCMDSFWDAVVDQVFGDEGALIDVLQRCDRRGTFLIWPRRRAERGDYENSGDVGAEGIVMVRTLC